MSECECDRCNKTYAVWFTENDLWNKFSDGYNFLCPTCFTFIAEFKGGCKTTAWFITTEERRKE